TLAWRCGRRLGSICPCSLLRYFTTEGLQRDGIGLGSAAHTGVESIDGREIPVRELEVEHVDVLGDAVWCRGLGDSGASLLQVPAQHHLGRGLAVRLGDAADHRVLK